MTFKKINKSIHLAKKEFLNIRGQSIFEYFILTAVVVAAVLFFASTDYFINIKDSCKEAFSRSVEEILE